MTAALEDVRLLAAQGRFGEALAGADERVAEAPDDPDALLLKADVLTETRDAEAAREWYRRAAAAGPRHAGALAGLARCLHLLGENEEAVAVAEDARSLLHEGDNFRHTAPVYLTLVWSLRDLRRYPEALAKAEEGLLRCPDAVLAQWASTVEEELAEDQKDRC